MYPKFAGVASGLTIDYRPMSESQAITREPATTRTTRVTRKTEGELGTVEATAIDSASPWLLPALQKVAKMGAIGAWELTGASPPNPIAVKSASLVLTRLSQMDFPPDRIAPSSDEGVCISFRRGGRYADIESFNTGEMLAVINEVGGEPVIWELEQGELSETIAKINAFIIGKKK